MAAIGFTPIQLYYSSTAAALPSSSNLQDGELAINITDGKLYYKDNLGNVQLLASKAALVGVDSITFGTTGLTPATATTGNVTVAGTLVLAHGGTGATTQSGARTNLGATTLGSNLFTITNPSATTFPRFNSDNTVSTLSASDFRTAIGAGTGAGSVTSVDLSGGTTGLTVSGTPITTSGTMTLAGTLAVTNGGTGLTSLAATRIPFGSGTSAFGSTDSFEFDNTSKRLFINDPANNVRGGSITIGDFSGSPSKQLSFVDTVYEEVVSYIYQSSGLLNYDSNSLGANPYSSAHVFRKENVEKARIQNGLSIGTTTDPGNGSILATGSISDSIGNVRSIPQTTTASNYILQLSDNGKHINYTLNNGSVETPSLGTAPVGYVVTIFNNTNTGITIYEIGTLRQAGTTNTGNRTLSAYGVATILCVATNTYVISGTGLA